MNKSYIILLLLLIVTLAGSAQEAIRVGKGSYAAYTPLYKSKSDTHPGDQSRYMEERTLYITPQMQGKPIPTNDWWTQLITIPYSGKMWAYPIVTKAESYGISIEYPKHWDPTGRVLESATKLEVMSKQFNPSSAEANGWSDWGVDFMMQDQAKSMRVTMVQGMPFTWVECSNLVNIQLGYSSGTIYNETQQQPLPYTGSQVAIRIGEDDYGVYAPEGSVFDMRNGMLEVTFLNSSAPNYIVIATLPSFSDLTTFAPYAYTIPRDTKVAWRYDQIAGKLRTTWSITTENLRGRDHEKEVMQGFLPHHYNRSELGFTLSNISYRTPRGEMRMAIGHKFSIDYEFNGILPWQAAPQQDPSLSNPYNRDRMVQMISQYADKGSFGGDTYWGGKGLKQMAFYMSFAHEMGEKELFDKCRNRLRGALENWFTFTPAEDNYFFARYNRWGALVGYNTSYDSETFNDHHFHYGYFTLSSAMLMLVDPEFRQDYGEITKMVAKDYANWDREDERFPLFRTFSPWSGHSYAGGLGDGNGNGQESTSEAMQGWGGVYLTGVATGDTDMRDAGIFGWVLESRATAEYWFDRTRQNIDYTKYDKPWSSNLTTPGIGWWTWFSGDPVWMHSIQWMPISPALKYLYEDPAFARWDYNQMMQSKEIGGFEVTNTEVGNFLSKESGLGNVVLSYLQIFDPNQAARIFDDLWDHNMPTARNVDTAGETYYTTHSHRTYGDIAWDIHASLPTATTYLHPTTGIYTYSVYNPSDQQQSVTFYRGSHEVVSFKAPARQLTSYSSAPQLATIKLIDPPRVIAPSASIVLQAQAYDQYGATIEVPLSWATDKGAISPTGLLQAPSEKTELSIRVWSAQVEYVARVRVDEIPVLTEASLHPASLYAEKGSTISYSLRMLDQYGDPFVAPIDWAIYRAETKLQSDSIFDIQQIGSYRIEAQVDGKIYSQPLTILPPLPNIAIAKRAYSSSEENVGTPTAYVNDGDRKSRWSSKFTDDQWVAIDLGESYYIGHVAIDWQEAYASKYQIQVSDNGSDWQTIEQLDGQGGYERIKVGCSARYVRMLGIRRAGVYGYSILEFEVYGLLLTASQDKLLGIDIEPQGVTLKQGIPIQLSAKGYNIKAQELPISPVWYVDPAVGTISTDGLFTPTNWGKATVEAEATGLKSQATYVVEESIRLASIELMPRQSSLIIDTPLPISIQTKDQFGAPFAANALDYEIIGAPSATYSDQVFSATEAGFYQLVIGKGKLRDTIDIRVAPITEVNLALNRPTTASSSENQGTAPSYATDGDQATRWSSGFSDNQYIQVDMQESYVISRVHLSWQSSFAKSYRIDISMDQDNWTTVYSQPNNLGADQRIDLAPVAARYIRIVCQRRNSVYGSSLWELEVYGTAIYQEPQPTSIAITPQPLVTYIGESIQVEAQILDQYGLEMEPLTPLSYQLSGGGTITATGLLTPTEPGSYELIVQYQSLSISPIVEIRDSKQLSRIEIRSALNPLKVGERVQLEAIGYDQYDSSLTVTPLWSSSGGEIGSTGVFVATAPGQYLVSAQEGSIVGTLLLDVITTPALNLALNKPTESSTALQGGLFAVDGNLGTRWESAHQVGPEWLEVDMGKYYHLTDVEIVWEGASAANYELQLSSNQADWQLLSIQKGLVGARTDQIRLSGTGRYLRVYCTLRNGVWGYSIFELRAYGVEQEPVAVDRLPGDSPVITQSEGWLSITSPDMVGCELYDMTGCRVYSQPDSGYSAQIQTADLPSGGYVIRLFSAQGASSHRVVIP